jgi:hypothetical protein
MSPQFRDLSSFGHHSIKDLTLSLEKSGSRKSSCVCARKLLGCFSEYDIVLILLVLFCRSRP